MTARARWFPETISACVKMGKWKEDVMMLRKQILILMFFCLVLIPSINAEIQDTTKSSEIIIKNIILPQGLWEVTATWGHMAERASIESDGKTPLNVKMEFPEANIRSELKILVRGAKTKIPIEMVLVPTFRGYKLLNLIIDSGIEFTDTIIAEIVETVSTALVSLKLSGIQEDIEVKTLKLRIEGEEITPLITGTGGFVNVAVGSRIVIDPGAELDLELEHSSFRVRASISLVSDRLIASGDVEGNVEVCSMEIGHIIGRMTFYVQLPILEADPEQVILRQTTSIIFRRDPPEATEMIVIIQGEMSEPLQGAEVKIFDEGGIIAQGKSDAEGVFRAIVNETQVQVSISCENYEPFLKKVDLLKTPVIHINLSKKKGPMEIFYLEVRPWLTAIRPYVVPTAISSIALVIWGITNLRRTAVFIGSMTLVLAFTAFYIG